MWTISLSRPEDAKTLRLELMEERKAFVVKHDQKFAETTLIYASIDYPLLVPHWTQVLPLRNDYAMCPPCIQINIMQKGVLSQKHLLTYPATAYGEISCWLTVAFDGVIIYILSDLVEGGLHEIGFIPFHWVFWEEHQENQKSS